MFHETPFKLEVLLSDLGDLPANEKDEICKIGVDEKINDLTARFKAAERYLFDK
jgi:hypothetical protein